MKTHDIISTLLLSTSLIYGSSSAALSTLTKGISSTTTSNTIIKFNPWPKPIIESHGDYTKESYLENEIIGGPLYEHQTKLPHLPLPSLGDSIKLNHVDNVSEIDKTTAAAAISKLLSSALPLAENESEITNLIRDCKLFPQQVQELQLQSRLEERREECSKKQTSWLQLWWNQIGYLKYREPNIVNVSYFFQLDDDPTLSNLPSKNTHEHHTNGIRRGASALTAMAHYRKLVCSGKLPFERIGKQQTPLCSTSFKYMFHSCRIPRSKQSQTQQKQQEGEDIDSYTACDTFKLYDPSLNQHCIVACKGQFYAMDFVNKDNDPLPLSVLEKGLEHIVELAAANTASTIHDDSSRTILPELGLFTSGHRDTWANTRDGLLEMGGKEMEKAMALLESGAFVLCLDDSAPITKKECANIYWHGNKVSGSNRWFDKSINLLCQSNGKLGFMGEHSLMDGMPMVGLCNYLKELEYGELKKEYISDGDDSSNGDMPQIQDIFGTVFSKMDTKNLNVIKESLNEAKHAYEDLVDNQELNVLSFQGFGSNYIKKSGYSPDSFVQMALQLASYRLFGKQVGTYESSQTRAFLHGRTETIRSVSKQSEAFVKAMGRYSKQNENDDIVRKKKLALLKDATDQHTKYIKDASEGYGIDRYFFGLSMVLKEDEHVSLFSNPLFERSKTWRLSTSTLPNLPGFGPVVEDGLGIAYEIRPDCCYFTVTSRRKNQYTESFSHLVEEALLEIQTLIDLDKLLLSKL